MTGSFLHLPACNYRRDRWRNQQGWTREILRVPDTDAFRWRTSIAEISQDTMFSPYPGYRRAQVLLQGEGLQLGFVDGRRVLLEPPFQRIQFEGDDVVACHLPAGPVHVFNAIWNPIHVNLSLLHRPLVGSMVFLHEPHVAWFLHLLAGHASLRAERECVLAQGDSLTLKPAPSERLVLEGAGEALLLRLATSASDHIPDSPPIDST
ncbi:HutD family protein [Xanthomonadaceae bacterium JHOS43]|nr:HutD family protein [Xanthomonadaceae bacterium JHOS43]